MTMAFEESFGSGSWYPGQEDYLAAYLQGTSQDFWAFAPEFGGDMGFFNGAGDILGSLSYPENDETYQFNTQDVLSTAGQIARLVGRAVGNQTDKFNAEAYPLMAQQARASGIPVDCFWFGDMVRVMPDGTYAAIGATNTLAEAESLWSQWAKGVSFYLLRCGGQGTPLLTGCHFDLMGGGNPIAGLYPGTAGGAGVAASSVLSFGVLSLILLAIAGVAAWLVWGKNK